MAYVDLPHTLVREILRDSLRESERVGRELLAPYDNGN
jgi:hypothetical protein